MNDMRFSGANTSSLYPIANKAAKLPKTIQQKWPVKSMSSSLGQFFNNDYHEFPKLALGKLKIALAEPPRAALLLLLYPGTVGPRLYRAYERGKKNKDYREMWDVLRRDMTAITFFIFALAPIVKGLSKIAQRISNVKLMDPKSTSVLAYSQFRNYDIDSHKALQAIMHEENGEALFKAVHGLSEKNMPPKTGQINLQSQLKQLKASVQSIRGLKSLDEDQAKALYQKFLTLETNTTQVMEEAQKSGQEGVAKMAKSLQGEFTGVLKNYARAYRMPADLVSFALVIGLIGWFPVWFNSKWNKIQFEKKLSAQNKAPGPAPRSIVSQPPLQAAMPMTPFNSYRYPANTKVSPSQNSINPGTWLG